MMSYKPYLILGALLLVSFAISTTADCEGFRGQEMVDNADELDLKKQCWFREDHQYLMKFKLQLLNTIAEQNLKLIKSTCEKCVKQCKCTTDIKSCAIKEYNLQADCLIDNIQASARTYADLEKCCGKALDCKQLTLVRNFTNGVMIGWKQVHTTC